MVSQSKGLTIYYLLLSRGINGCYVFATNPNMHKYLQEVVRKSQ